MSAIRTSVSVISMAMTALLVVACAGQLENADEFNTDGTSKAAGANTVSPESCGDVTVTFFKTDCATSGCHGAASPSADLDLASDGVGARLKGKSATASGFLLIDPAAPEKSAIYTKLLAPPPFGARMPLGGGAVSATTSACVLEWVRGVASGG